MSETLLEVRDLKVHFDTPDGVVKAVDGVSFRLNAGERLGIVGESGSGKSVTFLTVMGLITRKEAQISGEVIFRGDDLLTRSQDEMRAVRGKGMAMVFQDPMTSLHPFYRVGDQVAEAILVHEKMSKKDARERAVEMLRTVGIPRPDAMALSLNPALLIADEPTTALDVTVQAQILDLVDRLRDELGTAVVIITHDLGVVAEHSDRVHVMYAGRIAESGTRADIYYRAHHPYTWGLLRSIARMDEERDRLQPIEGAPPSLIFVPPGCSFHPRCPYVMKVCREVEPALEIEEDSHASACHLAVAEKKRIFQADVLRRA